MKRIMFVAAAVVIGASANAVVLYNKLTQSYTTGNGDWDGGVTELGSNAGLQVGQRVTAQPNGVVITHVAGRFLMFTNQPNNGGALVQVFNLSGNTVGSMVGQQAGAASMVSAGPDNVFGLQLIDVSMNVNIAGLTAGNDYLVVIQGRGSNWGYIARNANGAQNTFLRDNSSFGYGGGYGHTDWREAGADGFGSGDANMLVEAIVPEPATLLAIGAGLTALAARRRRK
jgi:hypothetical protein